MMRAIGVEEPPDSIDPEYVEGLRDAVAASIEYGICSVEHGEEDWAADVPPSLIAQARLAARCDVRLDTVLRRYFVGFTLFGEFLLQEAQDDGSGLEGATLQRTLRSQAAHFDRLLATVSGEYARTRESRAGTLDCRRAERIEKLLAGEPVDTSDFAYDLEGSHLGVIASGADALASLRGLARALDARLLNLERGGIVWGWVGRREPFNSSEAEERLASALPSGSRVALGEPGRGREGWRLSHRQARAAWLVALRSPETCVRYGGVALQAAAIQDNLLGASLRNLYIRPLVSSRDGGRALMETLRTYLATGRNASSAAAALGVSRQTVVNRLRAAETRLGRSLDDCATDLDIALRFADLPSA